MRPQKTVQPVRVAQFLGAAAIALAYLYWTWSDQISDFAVDSALYLLMAQHWSPWAMAGNNVAATFSSQGLFPPLFPAFLAIFDAGNNVLLAHLITTGFLLAWLIVFYLWTRTLEFERWMSSILVLVLALLPVSYLQVLHIHSENAYLLFSLVALFTVSKAEIEPSVARYAVAAVLVAAASLTRAAGISLVAAFLLYLAVKRPRGWPKLWAVSAGPFIVWLVARSGHSNSYVSWFIQDVVADPLGPLVTVFEYMLPATRDGFLESFGHSRSGFIVGHVLGLLSIAGAVYRARLGKLDGYYAIAYLGLILLWPFPAQSQRFVFCILPVLLVQGLLVSKRIMSHIVRAPSVAMVEWGYVLAILVIAILELAFHVNRYGQLAGGPGVADPRVPGAYEIGDFSTALRTARAYETMRIAMRRVERTVPQTGCVLSIVPSVVSFYSNRLSVQMPKHFDDDRKYREEMDMTGCRYALLINFKTPSFPDRFYPAARVWHDAKVHWTYLTGVPGDPPAAIMVERLIDHQR